jgi:hypothetical protein
MVIELQEQLLLWERGLNKCESALVARENDEVAAKSALGRACMEYDTEHN